MNKYFLNIILVLILLLSFNSCKTIFPEKEQEVQKQPPGADLDSVGFYGTAYTEKYAVKLNILKGDTVIFSKKITSDTASVYIDSITVDPSKNYSVTYYCFWQGARLDYALKMNVANVSYLIDFSKNEYGKMIYREKLNLRSPKLVIKFGVCMFAQDL